MTKTKEELAEEWSINELSKTDAHGLERLLLHLWTLDAYNAGYKEGYEAGQPKWISVEDRLPEVDENGESKSVIAITTGKFLQYVHIDDLSQGAWNSGGNVTHWMPIPTLPKDENEN